MSPRVSVLVPCFNLGAFLDEAVASVLAQSFRDVEILIVDDGSTDPETRELLADYRRARTRVFHTPNQGLAAARNFLIARAKGEYLCALDADDRLHPELLAEAVSRLDGDPSLAFVSCWLEAFGGESWQWRQERCDLPTLLAEDTVVTAAVARREAVIAVGGYDEAMPHPGDEDWELWIRLLEAGYRGTIIPRVLFHYRRRPGSMSEGCTRGSAHLELVAYLLDRHAQSYREHLGAVLLHKEAEIADLLRRIAAAEREEAPARAELEGLQLELERLERKLGGESAALPLPPAPSPLEASRTDPLEAALVGARCEIAALRSSLSWRLTAPLRALYEAALRIGRRA